MLGALTLLCTLAITVDAQPTAEYRRRLDALEPQWRAARVAVDAKEQERRQVARAIPIERGALRLVVDSALVASVTGPAEEAAGMLGATFGDAAGMLAERTLAVRVKSGTTGGTQLLRIGTPGRETTVHTGKPEETHRRLVAALTGAHVTGALHAALDDSARAWIRAPLPATRESASDREAIYVELVTASTDVSRRCLAGEVRGCRQMLGLAPVDDPLLEGHTAAQRRGLVSRRSPELRVRGASREFDRCVIDHDDSACIARLRTLPTELFMKSVGSNELRRSFMRTTLGAGGAHAYDRFSTSDSLPLEERLSAAGGAPLDTLIARWREGVLAARPARTPVNPVTALATLAWILATGAMALRSSRWR